MKKFIIGLIFMLLVNTCYTQTNIDSLINILHITPNLPIKEKIRLYMSVCDFYAATDNETMMKYAKEGLDLVNNGKDKYLEGVFYRALGGIYDVKAEFDTALMYYNKVLKLGLEIKNDDLEGGAYRSFAFTYFRQGKYILALEYCMKVLQFYEKIGNESGYTVALGNIGELHQILGNTDRAIYYIEQAKSLAEKNKETYLQAQCYNVLSIIYSEKNKQEKALHYGLKALEMSNACQSILYQSTSMQTLAKAYNLLNDYKKAIECADKSLEIAYKINDPTLIVSGLKIVSDIYRDKKNYDKSLAAAYKAWAIDSTNLNNIIDLTFNITLANMYLGNEKEAEKYLYKNTEAYKQKTHKNFQQTLLEMEVKYETEKKELRIAALEKEKKLTTWLIIVSAIVLLLIICLFLTTYKLNVKKQKIAEQQIKQLEQEKQLVIAHAILEGETTERLRIARDLHDGLGGMLSVIKLNLKDIAKQYANKQLEKALTLLEQSITELRHIAHHMMPESLINEGLKTSLEDFCQTIPNVHFEYIGNDSRLSKQLEILIYRCAYELINNALKYANAETINVQLIVDSKLISFTVYDNGIGFDYKSIKQGTGLRNIRTRIVTYNGKLNIYSSQGKGSEINIEIENYDNSTYNG